MTREEMLEKLQFISFGAEATEATIDMGLQYDYVCPEGAGTSFGLIGDRPAHYIRPIDKDTLNIIRTKISTESLEIDDFADTDLKAFYDYVFQVDRFEESSLSKVFAGLNKLPNDYGGELFCLCDARSWDVSMRFFT